MVTKRQYIEFLLATPGNATASYLAEHLEGVSHDQISDYLRREKITGRHLYALVKPKLTGKTSGYLLLDDSVQSKEHARVIESATRQYSGAEGGIVRGIGIVNLVYSTGAERDFWPIDFRIYDKLRDGKTKNEHFREMLLIAVLDKQVPAKTVLFDSWYSSSDNLKVIHRLGLTFYTAIKGDRMVSASKEAGWVQAQDFEFTDEQLEKGVWVRLKKVPFAVRLFKLVATNGDIDWVITNNPDSKLTREVAQKESKVRWQIEELHRGLKQLVQSDRCQARKTRAQRTHLACCYQAWVALKVKAVEWGVTLYQAKNRIFADFLRAQLKAPLVPAYHP